MPKQPSVAATFPRTLPASPSDISVTSTDWQAFFGDEQLKHLISTALSNNTDLMLSVRRCPDPLPQDHQPDGLN